MSVQINLTAELVSTFTKLESHSTAEAFRSLTAMKYRFGLKFFHVDEDVLKEFFKGSQRSWQRGVTRLMELGIITKYIERVGWKRRTAYRYNDTAALKLADFLLNISRSLQEFTKNFCKTVKKQLLEFMLGDQHELLVVATRWPAPSGHGGHYTNEYKEDMNTNVNADALDFEKEKQPTAEKAFSESIKEKTTEVVETVKSLFLPALDNNDEVVKQLVSWKTYRSVIKRYLKDFGRPRLEAVVSSVQAELSEKNTDMNAGALVAYKLANFDQLNESKTADNKPKQQQDYSPSWSAPEVIHREEPSRKLSREELRGMFEGLANN